MPIPIPVFEDVVRYRGKATLAGSIRDSLFHGAAACFFNLPGNRD